ncbi:hypothetical protein GIB67_030325 [Kingdonia uniflora]|uniref:Uncharacterized protein n=1 Tax=Kingdonia uniflora TaxID=39325 RepID=A0A7J7M6X8_9MAGN|nr:hypothetical protein GIB67_030325 [Kingdonia uniflora]
MVKTRSQSRREVVSRRIKQWYNELVLHYFGSVNLNCPPLPPREASYEGMCEAEAALWRENFHLHYPVDKVLATFVMGQSEIDRLKKWDRERIIEKNKQTREPPPNFSMHVEPPLPQTYFGNCVEACPTTIDTIDLTDDDGVAVAAEVITKGIKTAMIMKSSAGSDMKMVDLFKMASERIITVAGSPILRLYDTDFGWGRPTKVDIVSICDTGAISLSERRDGEAGLEVGLSLKKEEMEAFASLFSECIKGLPQ